METENRRITLEELERVIKFDDNVQTADNIGVNGTIYKILSRTTISDEFDVLPILKLYDVETLAQVPIEALYDELELTTNDLDEFMVTYAEVDSDYCEDDCILYSALLNKDSYDIELFELTQTF